MVETKKRYSIDGLNQLALVLLLVISYVYFLPRWADQSVNSRMDMILAVVNDGTFQIDRYVKNTVDYAEFEGHYYSDKPPGAAFLGIPVYAGLRFILQSPMINPLVERLGSNGALQATLNPQGTGIFAEKLQFAIAQVLLTYLLATLPTIILALLMYRFFRKTGTSPAVSALVVLGYSLMTPAYAYASAYYSHQLSAALLFAAFYLAHGLGAKHSAAKLAAIGFLISYAFISEYAVILIAGVIFLYTLYKLYQQKSPFQIAWAVLPGLLVAAAWMVYNNAVFGGPLSLGYSYSTAWTEQHSTGFMSLTYPHWEAIWGITFSLYRGMFILSPFLLLFIPGIVLWWKSGQHRPELLVSVSAFLLMILFNSSSIMWWGGFTVGPRYMLPAIPFMVLPIARSIQQWSQKGWFRLAAGLLFALSFATVWMLTLAGQAFPSDTIRNPIFDYALPSWQTGSLARSFGTLLGLKGLAGVIPLVMILAVVLALWAILAQRITRKAQPKASISLEPVSG